MNARDQILPEIDQGQCAGCGDCVAACPAGVLALVEGGVRIAHAEDCQYCGDCEDLCAAGAIARPFEIVLAKERDRPGR